jgi:hypothetical protein
MMISRREWLFGSPALYVAAAMSIDTPAQLAGGSQGFHTYFGDLHNHNAVGYAQGSLERTFEIARNHLDFFAFTPHGYWPDIGHYENGIENKWLQGFEVTRERWPEVLRIARAFDDPGRFVPIVGYERHSTSQGDRHILFPDLNAEYKRFEDLHALQGFARDRGCIMVPHHPANRVGHRGLDISSRDASVEPLLEIYSEWGNAEHDRAPFGYIRHTEGGRWTRNTLQYLLAKGHRMGVIASTDDHLGCPGGYREGLAAVKAAALTRDAIFDALRNRRTYAVTGDRIMLDFWLNGRIMGQAIPAVNSRVLKTVVTGWDQIDRVEILKNNRVVHRDFPMDRIPSGRSWQKPVLIRFEYGWGPWPALSMTRVADWIVCFELEGGAFEDVHPCFLPGPLDEKRRDRIVERKERTLRLESFTALRQQVDDVSQKAVVLKVRGGPETKLKITVESPGKGELIQSLGQLSESGEMLFTGDFPKESAMVHRLVFADHYHTEFEIRDRGEGGGPDYYYSRVIQANGQLAWSSPIWVG